MSIGFTQMIVTGNVTATILKVGTVAMNLRKYLTWKTRPVLIVTRLRGTPMSQVGMSQEFVWMPF